MIQINNLGVHFGQQIVFKDFSLSIPKGELVAVLGRSGTGKSVLLKCLVGLLKPQAGSIHYSQRPLASFSQADWVSHRKRCSYVFQHPTLFDSMSVFENLAFGLRRSAKVAAESIPSRVHYIAADLGIESSLSLFPHEISYGTQKRVGIGRSLVLAPETLLFDEPTTGLDPETSHQVDQLILDLHRKHRLTTIVVSHDIAGALRIADRVVLMDQGQAVVDGEPSSFHASQHPLAIEFNRDLERPA